MERKRKKNAVPRDPVLPDVHGDVPETNRFGSTSEVPVAQPWILPPDWPPEDLL